MSIEIDMVWIEENMNIKSVKDLFSVHPANEQDYSEYIAGFVEIPHT